MCLGGIAEEAKACMKCDLGAGRHKTVPGEGPCDAEILLVGEAPGAEEDLSGRPFVGRAGKVLDRALAQAVLDRSKIFITSIIKCRPPGNRKPKAWEIEECLPLLQAQIGAIKPRAIGLMGNVAAKAVLGLEGVTGLHGQVFQDRYVITYHPAAILRRRELQEDLVSDLKKLKELSLSRK
jgi:uracil-DNA glycosylase